MHTLDRVIHIIHSYYVHSYYVHASSCGYMRDAILHVTNILHY